MNALHASFGFTVTDCDKPISLRLGEHVRISTEHNESFGEDLSSRQVDLLHIAMAVHLADAWVLRRAKYHRLRHPILKIEVIDKTFWSDSTTVKLLKHCVDFLSGGDNWEFSFVKSTHRHRRSPNLFRDHDQDALVAPYSGGLDSAAGLAIRAAQSSGRLIVPVNIRHQKQKSELLRRHFKLLLDRRIVIRRDLCQFIAPAFFRKKQIATDSQAVLREISHRCRPFLFMAVAGIVAETYRAREVQVFESGIGSVNLPLVSGPADYRTTRSTHPHFLRLLSALVSHVNDAPMNYTLPFADKTKAEMASLLKPLALEQLARDSFSCIMHPLRRKGWQQCGICPACIFRRQALFTAGIPEDKNAYGVDLFSEADPSIAVASIHMQSVRAFRRQIERLRDLDCGSYPQFFRRYLRTTRVVDHESEIAPVAEVYRRYRREWMDLLAEARRRNFPWMTLAESQP